MALCARCPRAIGTGPVKGHGAGAFLYPKRSVGSLEVGSEGVPGEGMGKAVVGIDPDVPYPDPPELLGSTKRLNINYQDADGYVLLGKGWSLGRGKRKGPGAPRSVLSYKVLQVCFPRALGPACVGPEGGGPAHPPAYGVS